jgi:radical SAM protein with 4Fe4S-binding SPASM domain
VNAQLKDAFEILKKGSILKVWNFFLLLISFRISRLMGKVVHWGEPFSLSFEPTTTCNLGCPECPSGLRQFSRDTGNAQMDQFKGWINQVTSKLWYLTFYFQGEPYLNQDFLKMVSYASKKGVYTATSTNAHYLTKEKSIETVKSGLSRVIISIDGTTQEVYEQYRKRGKLDKVLEGTKNLIEARKELKSNTPHIIFQFLVVKPNEHQIEDVVKLGNELGVDEVRFKTAQVYDYENGNPLLPDNEEYSRYRKGKDGKFRLKNKMLNHCWRMWQGCVVTWDGKVVPCCFDKDATHQLGDLNSTSFNTLWKSAPYNDFRSSVLTARDQIDICTNCTEGTQVWT